MTTCTYCGKEDFEHGVGLDCAGFKSAFPTNTAEAKVKAVYPEAHQRLGWVYNLPFGPGCHQIGRSWADAAEKIKATVPKINDTSFYVEAYYGHAISATVCGSLIPAPSPTEGTPEPAATRTQRVLTKGDIEKINKGNNHRCGWDVGPVKNPHPECGCMCGTVYNPQGQPIISHYPRHSGRPDCKCFPQLPAEPATPQTADEPLIRVEHRHSDYGDDAGGYSVLKVNGKWVGRVDDEAALKPLIDSEREKDGLITELRAIEHTKAEEIVRKQTLLDEAVNEVTALRKRHDALLEALKGVVKQCKGWGYVGRDGQYLKLINAAIAAAEKLTGRKG